MRLLKYLGIGDNFAAGSDESGVEIEDDVDEEDDVDDRIDHQEADILGRLVLEGHVEGHHNGRVEGEEQDDVVPEGLEGAVMQQYVRRRLGRLLAVLRHHVSVQAHHLLFTIIVTITVITVIRQPSHSPFPIDCAAFTSLQ